MKTNYLNHQEVVPQHQANSSKTNCETIQKHIKENIHYILSDFWMENMPSASTHGQYPFIKQFWEGLLSD